MATICLNCGSIDYIVIGSSRRYYTTNNEGYEEEIDSDFEFEEEQCERCGGFDLVHFNWNDLSEQEKIIFLHLKGNRRLLYFLKISLYKDSLLPNRDINFIEQKISELEKELGV